MKKADSVAEGKTFLAFNVLSSTSLFRDHRRTPKSYVEIMVVGALDLVELDEIVSSLEQTWEEPVDVTLFTAKELRDRIKVKDTFVLWALKEPKIALTGEDFLANPRLIPYNV